MLDVTYIVKLSCLRNKKKIMQFTFNNSCAVVGEVHRGTVWDPAGICYPQTAAQDMSGPPVSGQTSVPPPANTRHRPRQVKSD